MTLGQKIKKLRTQKHLTQKELAEKVFVTFQTVSKWEKDENEPDVSTLRELAKLFGCSMDYLLNEEEEEVEENKPSEALEQVTKTVIIHQREAHVCQRCKKDIPEEELAVDHFCVRRAGRGHGAEYRDDYYHRACLDVVNKERAEKAEAERKEKIRRAKVKSFGWGIFAAAVAIAVFMIGLFTKGELPPVAIVFISIGMGYVAFATVYCILSGSYIEDIFLAIASWSIRLPGVIFSFDLEGLVFLVVAKLILAAIGFLFSLFTLALGFGIAALFATVSFPFVLAHNIHTGYAGVVTINN